MRAVDRSERSSDISLSAAMGGILEERRAGMNADSMVTTTPITSASTTTPPVRPGTPLFTVKKFLTRLMSAAASSHPEQQAEHGGDQADEHGLEHGGAQHLAAAGPDGAEQGGLPACAAAR